MLRRRLFNVLSTVSLALFVATLILWGRSYWVSDRATWARVTDDGGEQFCLVRSGRGEVAICQAAFPASGGGRAPPSVTGPAGRAIASSPLDLTGRPVSG